MSAIDVVQQINYKGQTIKVFELCHESGSRAVVSNYGCVLMKLVVKDNLGGWRDVVLGFDSIVDYFGDEYLKGYPYFGAVVGRYANRIKNASFMLDDELIQLADNKSGSTLHGGFEGFDKKVWDVLEIKNEANPSISFQLMSPDGDEGFPGTLTTKFTITLTATSLQYNIEAVTDAATAVNLSYHPYFNLDETPSTIIGQKAKIYAKHWLQQGSDFCLTGKILSTELSEHDFGDWKPVLQLWNKDDGFDQTFIADKNSNAITLMAEAMSSDANLRLQVYSTEPVVHFYTGKWIPRVKGKNGFIYGPFSGYCFETHQYPNAVNIPAFPNTILRPGEIYRQTTIYQF
jgi:aldose 1-epimerase